VIQIGIVNTSQMCR